jgi:hypothetical protein
MPAERRISLTNGLWQDGVCHRDAELRPLAGADEILLAEAEPIPAVQASVLLATTVRSIGPISPVTHEHIRQLTIGDREKLLVALYALSFGPLLDAVLRCPACAETVELPLDLDTVLEAPAGSLCSPQHSLMAGGATLRFRIPNGADHERAARIAAIDPNRGAAVLRSACVIALTGGDGQEIVADRMPDGVQAALEEALRRLDPAAETIIAADCPGCGTKLEGTLDALSLLAGQLGQRGSILGDVDQIARAYHWSEEVILALPTARRRRYLAFLDRARAA